MDIIRAVAKRAGFKIKLRPMDFNGIIPALQAGSVDIAIAAITITPERSILGRAAEIESVVSNLLTNAARYTPDRERIEITWHRGEQGAYLAVRDNGPGIAAAHVPRLTERFYRADPGR